MDFPFLHQSWDGISEGFHIYEAYLFAAYDVFKQRLVERKSENCPFYTNKFLLDLACRHGNERAVKLLLVYSKIELTTKDLGHFQCIPDLPQPIYQLLSSYQRDPIETLLTLKGEMRDDHSAEVFSLVVFHSDGFLAIANPDKGMQTSGGVE